MTKATWGRKCLFDLLVSTTIQLTREIRAGTQGNDQEVGTKAEAIEEF